MTGPGGRRLALWPTLMTVPALAALLGLGLWQLDRLEWKNALIATRTANLTAAPMTRLPERLDAARHAYTRVRLEGRFRHDREFYLGPRTSRGRAGIHVITPMEMSDGSHVLVDRGWVPRARRRPETRAAGQRRGMVSVEGLLRAAGRTGWFTPDNTPRQNFWYFVDPAAMATVARLDRVRPYYVAAGPAPNPGGLPLGRAYAVEMASNHLQYALTWFALAVVLAVIYIVYHLRRRT